MGGEATAFILHDPLPLFSCETRMSNIYIYRAGDGAGIAGCHARWTRGRLGAVPSGCAGEEAGLVQGWLAATVMAQLPQEGGELPGPGGGGGVVPSAVLRKEV